MITKIYQNYKYLSSHMSPHTKWEKLVFGFYAYFASIYFWFNFFGIDLPKPLMHYFIYTMFLSGICLGFQAYREYNEILKFQSSMPHQEPFEKFAAISLKKGSPFLKGFGMTVTSILSANYLYGEYFGFSPIREISETQQGRQTIEQMTYHLKHPTEYGKSGLLPWQDDSNNKIKELEKLVEKLIKDQK